MRLWHYKLIDKLPNSQLIAQWRELNTIFTKQPKHILINYVYEYPKDDLELYSLMVRDELEKRGYRIRSFKNANEYFGDDFESLTCFSFRFSPFVEHHNEGYLLQCFYNLQEKYERGQRDFSESEYLILEHFVDEEVFGDPVQNDPAFSEALHEFLEENYNQEQYEEFANMVLEKVDKNNIDLLNLLRSKTVNIPYLRHLLIYFNESQPQDKSLEQILTMYNNHTNYEDRLSLDELSHLFIWLEEDYE